MATITSNIFAKPAITCNEAGDVLAVRASATTTSALAASDIIKMATLPAGYIITGGYLAATDLDTGGTAAITLTVGLMDVADTAQDSGTDLLTASTVGQAGGIAQFNVGLTQGPFTVDKVLVVTVAAAATTPAAGTVTCQMVYAQP